MLRRLTRALFGGVELPLDSREPKFRVRGAGARKRPGSRHRFASRTGGVTDRRRTRLVFAIVTLAVGLLVVLVCFALVPSLRFLTYVIVPGAVLACVLFVLTGLRSPR